MDFGKILKKESKGLNLELSPEFKRKCKTHHRLMEKWNKTCDLTSIEEPEKRAKRLYLESCIAMAMTKLEHFSFLDIGTGAGFPGLPLKFKHPGIELFLLEANKKKCFFLEQICIELDLTDVEILNIRAEKLTETVDRTLDYISFKAVGNTLTLMEKIIPVLKKNGSFIVFAGENLITEIKNSSEFKTTETKTVPWLNRCEILEVEPL